MSYESADIQVKTTFTPMNDIFEFKLITGANDHNDVDSILDCAIVFILHSLVVCEMFARHTETELEA